MTSASAQPSGRRQIIALVLAAVCVEIIYVYVVSAGHMTTWPAYEHFLNDLADGFRAGHLHLAIEPAPALLARPNPFAGENHTLWYWDASLYKGHYYLYWGPVPALMMAAGKTLFRVQSLVGDEVVVFALMTVQLAASTWILGRAARTTFAQTPLALQVLAVVTVGLVNPNPYNLARGDVYEAAIVGGQAFLLLGVACAFEAAARPEAPRRWLVAAGASWALALGCRMTVVPAIGVLVLLAVARWARGARWRQGAEALACLCAPLALGLGALLLYNRLRFDDWLEFGRRFQLTWINSPISPHYVFANLYSFFLRSPELSCRFPYVYALMDIGPRAFPNGYQLPPGYFVYEQVAGMLLAVPWCWAVPIGWVVAVRDGLRRRPLTVAWSVAMVSTAGLLGMSVTMLVASATNRYLGDGAGGIALAGAFGLWIAYAACKAHRARRRAVMAGAAVLGLLTIGNGLALSFYGQYAHFMMHNPQLSEKLVRALSVCHGPPAPPPK
jgi:hypothetical protein